jgi:hypothetical protein
MLILFDAILVESVKKGFALVLTTGESEKKKKETLFFQPSFLPCSHVSVAKKNSRPHLRAQAYSTLATWDRQSWHE